MIPESGRLDLRAVAAHLDELRALHRQPFPETTLAIAVDQARAIELGQAIQLAAALLDYVEALRAALEDHECVYEHGDGACEKCAVLAAAGDAAGAAPEETEP